MTWSQSGCWVFTRNTSGAPKSFGLDSELTEGPSADGAPNTFTDGTVAVATRVLTGAGATVVGGAVDGAAACRAVAPPPLAQPAAATTTATIAAQRGARITTTLDSGLGDRNVSHQPGLRADEPYDRGRPQRAEQPPAEDVARPVRAEIDPGQADDEHKGHRCRTHR